MKIERLFIYCLLATTCLFTACDKEVTANGDGVYTPLPEGMYPLTLTATQTGDEVQTRVSENSDGTSSTWTKGDQIKVKITGNGNDAETTCTLNASGQVTASNPKLFWKTNGTSTVTAWHPTTGTVSLADQSGGLKYVLKATATGANYKNSVPLSFAHQLAKVRVKLETGTTAADLTTATVTIKDQYTDCFIDNTGTVSSAGNANGTITMHKPITTGGYYEANIVPGPTLASGCIGITVGTNTVFATTLAITSTNAGEMYTFTITVDKPILQPVDGVFTINAGDDVAIKNYNGPATIVVNGSAKITLDNVKLNTDGSVMTINNGAQVNLNIKGLNNSFISTNGNGIEMKNNAGLTITGDSKETSKLVVNASSNDPSSATDLKAGIGPAMGNVSIKTISINNVYLDVSGGKSEWNGNAPAAIGLCSVNGTYFQNCTGISITDSKIKAISYGGACIGTGSVSNDIGSGGSYTLGEISIVGSEIEATAATAKGGDSGACIGFGYIGADAGGTIDKIIISSSTLNLTTTNGSAYKVGRGNIINNASYKITNGINVNGSTATEGWNSDSDKK